MKDTHSIKRLRIGVIFNFSKRWMGGIFYVVNIVKTLNFLNDDDKPDVFLFYKSDLVEFLSEFNYPYLTKIEWTFPSIVKGNVGSIFKMKNLFYDELINKYQLDAIYPANSFPVKNKTKAKIVAWYADLQHKYYPEFFSRKIILHRNIRIFFILRNASDLVVSSQSVKDDFYKFYKPGKNLRFHVYHFTSVNDDYKEISFNELRSKYNLPEKYFMVSNQFHKHKNHKVLLLAMAKLKEKGIKIQMALTGKFPKATDSPYLAELYNIIDQNKINDQISLLGIIPRGDQIQIMKYSQAVLQPSLFEGWSTVIEDAISQQVPVIASNLNVNIEQLGEKGTFFDPLDADQLASILCNYPERDLSKDLYGNYNEHIKETAEGLLKVFKEL